MRIMSDNPKGQTTTELLTSSSSKLIIATVIVAHAMIHFQSGVLPVLYPTMIMEFDINYVQLGVYNSFRPSLQVSLKCL